VHGPGRSAPEKAGSQPRRSRSRPETPGNSSRLDSRRAVVRPHGVLGGASHWTRKRFRRCAGNGADHSESSRELRPHLHTNRTAPLRQAPAECPPLAATTITRGPRLRNCDHRPGAGNSTHPELIEVIRIKDCAVMTPTAATMSKRGHRHASKKNAAAESIQQRSSQHQSGAERGHGSGLSEAAASVAARIAYRTSVAVSAPTRPDGRPGSDLKWGPRSLERFCPNKNRLNIRPGGGRQQKIGTGTGDCHGQCQRTALPKSGADGFARPCPASRKLSRIEDHRSASPPSRHSKEAGQDYTG